MSRSELLVAECFGPTFQGEGPSAGQLAMFIRLSRCNLSCPACDTPYTWDWSRFDPRVEARRLGVAEVASWTLGHPTGLVVVTGGEPLLQQTALTELVNRLAGAGRVVEIETNGTVAPGPELVRHVAAFNVSPKLSSFAARSDRDRRINREVLAAFAGSGKARFKFVTTSEADIAELVRLRDELELDPVWVMPAGTSEADVLAGLRRLAEPALAHGWHVSSRLHVLLWGDQRGR